MSRCDRQFLVVDYFFGELTPAEKKDFQAHLAGCTNCQKHLDALADTSKLVNAQQREQPPKELLRQYRLKLKNEFYEEKDDTSWLRNIWEQFILKPSVAVRFAEALVLILIGIFVGRFWIWNSATPTVPVQFSQDSSINELLLTNYLQETEMIFLDVANLDAVDDQKIILNLIQSAKYKYLIQKTLLLRDQAREQENHQLSDLLNQIELVLLELYNMETSSYTETLSIVKQQLNRSHILLEIKSLNELDI